MFIEFAKPSLFGQTGAVEHLGHGSNSIGAGVKLHLLFALAIVLTLGIPASQVPAADITMIDAHSQIRRSVGLDKALALMDQAGIARVILSPLGWHAAKPLLAFARSHPERIVAAIGLKPKALRNSDPVALQRLRNEGHDSQYHALSEVMIFHQQKGDKAPEIIVGLDSPYAKTALEIALDRNWPLVIHIEFGFARNTGRYAGQMQALEALLRRYPYHPFVLSHMGQLDAAEAKRLIDAHPNIYFLTSHANPIFIADHKTSLPWTKLFSGEHLAPQWKALFTAHPERFVLAFDNVYDEDWSSHYVRQAQLWRKAFADLPPAVANAVAHGNAERLWHLGIPSANQ